MRRREPERSIATGSYARPVELRACRTRPEAVVFPPGLAAAMCASLAAPLYCDSPSASDRAGRI